jgi:Flp pilus assembly protein TadB
VPLSEHEQRLLDQIEQALYAEDPKFASIYQGTDVRSHYRRRVVRAVIGLVVGLGLLLAGVILPLIPLGVTGFVVMLAAATFGVASWQRMTGHRMTVLRERSAGRGSRDTPAPGPKRSVVQRLEDRWQRRQDDR